MRFVLLWEDGRREEIPLLGGGDFVMKTRDLANGRTVQTTFGSPEIESPEGEGGPTVVYREGVTVDKTASYRENETRRRRDAGYQFWEIETKGFLPGETQEEQARRIQIMKGEIP